jgi:ribonuclease BN (tRNA processing enzyme)
VAGRGGRQSIVFTGDFSNRRNVMAEFAAGADALVIHHAIPEGTRGEATDLHVTPSQIGRIAAQAGVRMVILGHRTTRTRGLESISRSAIEDHYEGPVIFANDLECWGL